MSVEMEPAQAANSVCPPSPLWGGEHTTRGSYASSPTGFALKSISRTSRHQIQSTRRRARKRFHFAEDRPMHDVIDIEVTPLSSACGAEIKGVDLTKELSQGAVRAIKEAWAKHLVLVFRGQSITQEQQLRFASYFGELGNRRKAPEQLRSRAEGIRTEAAAP